MGAQNFNSAPNSPKMGVLAPSFVYLEVNFSTSRNFSDRLKFRAGGNLVLSTMSCSAAGGSRALAATDAGRPRREEETVAGACPTDVPRDRPQITTSHKLTFPAAAAAEVSRPWSFVTWSIGALTRSHAFPYRAEHASRWIKLVKSPV